MSDKIEISDWVIRAIGPGGVLWADTFEMPDESYYLLVRAMYWYGDLGI